jgi:demethylmenaquinone methyltransferase/2-methoxy-6-polyprenyl-1,4-benzoquinol methylase
MDKSRPKIEGMFDSIAPKYDFLNHLFTFNTDKRWRRKIICYIRENGIASSVIVDLASGTGDLTMELVKLNPEVLHSGDISENMLDIQRKKIKDSRVKIERIDALNMPFEDSSADMVTIGFGIRNFESMVKGLKEIKRVLKPGGYLVVLEMFRNDSFRAKVFDFYFSKVMPFVGNRVTGSKAYSYLSRSVKDFYTVERFKGICKEAGYEVVEDVNCFMGIVRTVYLRK